MVVSLSCVVYVLCCCCVFFVKQKTAYEMRISDWSSDVCSSDLLPPPRSCGIRYSPISRMNTSMQPVITPGADKGSVTWRKVRSGLAPRSSERSEERRVGNECVSTCRSRWSQYH